LVSTENANGQVEFRIETRHVRLPIQREDRADLDARLRGPVNTRAAKGEATR
jgi:hypothetical protein